MSALTIKHLPPELHQHLKSSALQHHRSLNSEVIFCLETALRKTLWDKDAFLHKVRALRKKTAHFRLKPQALQRAKGAGRP